MDRAGLELLHIMKKELGESGPFLLNREMKNLGFSYVDGLSDSEKERLVETIIERVFGVFSPTRRSYLRTKLRSAVNFSAEKDEEFNEQQEIDFLMGR